MPKKIGLLGGSFDPIHFGHLLVARSVLEQLRLESVVFLPSASPPHKPIAAQADAHHRAEMVRLAISGEPGFSFDDYDLNREGPSYTIETIEHFQEMASVGGESCELFWIIGADWIADIANWHRAKDLVDACQIVTACRSVSSLPDWTSLIDKLSRPRVKKIRGGLLDTPMFEVSSTQVRERMRKGLSIRYLVPEAVNRYIEQHSLYQS